MTYLHSKLISNFFPFIKYVEKTMGTILIDDIILKIYFYSKQDIFHLFFFNLPKSI